MKSLKTTLPSGIPRHAQVCEALSPMLELAQAAQALAPTGVGVGVDEIEFAPRDERTMRVAYQARPVRITILDGQRRFTLQLEDLTDTPINITHGEN